MYPDAYPDIGSISAVSNLPTAVSRRLQNSRSDPIDFKNASVKSETNMRFQNPANTNGNGGSNEIVEEWFSPNTGVFQGDFSVFKTLSDEEKVAVVRREAETYGIEKPQGYTVSFHYNANVEYHHFGSSHPMKPWRLTLTKQLVTAYGLEYAMQLHEPRPATKDELGLFHDREYLDFLKKYVYSTRKTGTQTNDVQCHTPER